jgi:hypothetical protein
MQHSTSVGAEVPCAAARTAMLPASRPWQHAGNIYIVTNRPGRPRKPFRTANLDPTDTTNTPLARLRALWGVSPVGVRVSLGA